MLLVHAAAASGMDAVANFRRAHARVPHWAADYEYQDSVWGDRSVVVSAAHAAGAGRGLDAIRLRRRAQRLQSGRGDDHAGNVALLTRRYHVTMPRPRKCAGLPRDRDAERHEEPPVRAAQNGRLMAIDAATAPRSGTRPPPARSRPTARRRSIRPRIRLQLRHRRQGAQVPHRRRHRSHGGGWPQLATLKPMVEKGASGARDRDHAGHDLPLRRHRRLHRRRRRLSGPRHDRSTSRPARRPSSTRCAAISRCT